MRGEFIGVWQETWNEIWLPVIGLESIPEDIFCELYRDIAQVLRQPSFEEAIKLIINDAILSKEIFNEVILLAEIKIDLLGREQAYSSIIFGDPEKEFDRKREIEAKLIEIVGDTSKVKKLLTKALSEMAKDSNRQSDAMKRLLENVVNDKEKSREAFERIAATDFIGERALVAFLEAVNSTLTSIGGDFLSNSYFNLLESFIEKFSLRYDLRRPCVLCPTLTGLFSSLMGEVQIITKRDTHLAALMKDFEEAVRDLRIESSDRRIKTCIQKQINLLEAIGRAHPRISRKTLGAICNQLKSWPHDGVKEAIKLLYGFTCDYPGIRHSGTPANSHRAIDMRDMIGISITLAGFLPYLTEQIDSDTIYSGA